MKLKKRLISRSLLTNLVQILNPYWINKIKINIIKIKQL